MDIGQIKKIIQNYLKGKASPEEQKWMEQWQEKAETEALETPDTGTYRHIKAQILQKIRQHATLSVPVPSGKKNTFPFRKSRWQHAAVSLSVLVVICFISFHYRYALLDLVNPVKEISAAAPPERHADVRVHHGRSDRQGAWRSRSLLRPVVG